MNNRRLLTAAVFHFVHPVVKDSSKHHKLTQTADSFSCQSKQVSRCCINFPHELTCQILTNRGIKIGRRVWSTRDHGNKTSSPPVFFRVRGHFQIKIFLVQSDSDTNTTYFVWIKKHKLELAIIWNLVPCQRITSKNNRPRWVDTWTRDTVGYSVLTAVNWSQYWCAISLLGY